MARVQSVDSAANYVASLVTRAGIARESEIARQYPGLSKEQINQAMDLGLAIGRVQDATTQRDFRTAIGLLQYQREAAGLPDVATVHVYVKIRPTDQGRQYGMEEGYRTVTIEMRPGMSLAQVKAIGQEAARQLTDGGRGVSTAQLVEHVQEEDILFGKIY